MERPPGRAYARLSALALALVLVVLFASAAIRMGADVLEGRALLAVRGVHRATASLEVLAMLAMLWLAWRRTLLAAALTVALSVLGILAGQQPPPAAAAGNLLGGLALAAVFAWLLGRRAAGAPGRARPAVHAAAGLFALQCALGAWVSIFADELWTWPLFAHALIGLALAGGAGWLALRVDAAGKRFTLLGLALAAPAAGFASALFGQPLAAALAHAAAAALLVAAAGFAHARLT